jgi:acyl-CoA thioester hydrolase
MGGQEQIGGCRPCYYGSVNRWECDENDHLNVRFFAQKINQATDIFLRQCSGAISPLNPLPALRSQHIRFIREARIATPLRVDCGLVAADAEGVQLLALMVHNLTNVPLAAFLNRFEIPQVDRIEWPERISLPDWAGPRGIDVDDAYSAQLTIEAAQAAGFQIMGRGVVDAVDCIDQGTMLMHNYLGRISDGMPNLWAFTTDIEAAAQRHEGELGGAALEYHLVYHEPLRAGEVFRQLSGIRAVGNKTQHMVHMLFNESRGELAASAEAIGLAMDLTARKAVVISVSRRRQLQTLMLD